MTSASVFLGLLVLLSIAAQLWPRQYRPWLQSVRLPGLLSDTLTCCRGYYLSRTAAEKRDRNFGFNLTWWNWIFSGCRKQPAKTQQNRVSTKWH